MSKLSVILPVYKNCMFLKDSITSILLQSYSDFQLIICYDSISLDCLNFLQGIKFSDKRVKLLNSEGKNLPNALNFGVENSNGEYIVRFDADDIMFPERLQKQVELMDTHLDVIASGGQMVLIDEKNRIKNNQVYYPTKENRLKENIESWCPFSHPTVIMRKASFLKAGGYNANFTEHEDVELWSRLSKFGRIINLEDPLIFYRIHNSQKSYIESKGLVEISQNTNNRIRRIIEVRTVLYLIYRKIGNLIYTYSVRRNRVYLEGHLNNYIQIWNK